MRRPVCYERRCFTNDEGGPSESAGTASIELLSHERGGFDKIHLPLSTCSVRFSSAELTRARVVISDPVVDTLKENSHPARAVDTLFAKSEAQMARGAKAQKNGAGKQTSDGKQAVTWMFSAYRQRTDELWTTLSAKVVLSC
jgi:hypothetical protein